MRGHDVSRRGAWAWPGRRSPRRRSAPPARRRPGSSKPAAHHRPGRRQPAVRRAALYPRPDRRARPRLRRPRRDCGQVDRRGLGDRLEGPTSSIPSRASANCGSSITALDAVDRGRVRLDDKVTLTRDDLTLFHQPIAAEVLQDGSYTTTLDDLHDQGDHDQRQHRQRQADAVGRRAGGGARDDRRASSLARSASTMASARCRAGSPG